MDIDGSPWGLGATLTIDESMINLLEPPLTNEDYRLHGFLPGDCKEQQTWECLSLLVAIRQWPQVLQQPGTHWTVRSDNAT
eukprot:3600620-Amphidinium_carterae.1